jgi:glycosyltransferase involved in cell wall biosynthesis
MSMTGPSVSVIVCTRNRASYLPACLASLAHQDCGTAYEVLVVDNASTDATPDVLAAWSQKDARFRIVREPTLGLSAAKNAGVARARGRLLLFTDDDVIVDSGWVRSYLDFFAQHGDDSILVGGPIVPAPEDLGQWTRWFAPCALADLGLLDYDGERPLGRYEYVWGANMAVPAALFRRLGSWDERVGRRGDARGTYEDTEYQDRARATGTEVWFCPSASLRHRVPRRDVTIARILRTAYARGRNQFWRETLESRGGPGAAPRDDYLSALGMLIARFGTLACWSLVLQFRRTSAVFARAHRAAWRAGWAMDVLRIGRESSRLSTTIGNASMFVLDSVLRLAPCGE